MTPTTQSVVVPVEPADEMISRAVARLRTLQDHTGERTPRISKDMRQALHDDLKTVLDALQAAPAPSSLASGEVTAEEIAEMIRQGVSGPKLYDAADFKAHDADLMATAKSILATLSPEAPARDGVAVVKGGQWDAHTGEDYAVVMLPNEHTENASIRVYSDDEDLPQRIADALNALTPRHEAPAEGAGEDEWSAERDIHCFAVVSSNFSRPFMAGAYATLEAATKAQCGSPEKWPIYVRYTHPAAPSADKMRIAVEALEKIASYRVTKLSCDSWAKTYSGGHSAASERDADIADQAIAALKAEGE